MLNLRKKKDGGANAFLFYNHIKAAEVSGTCFIEWCNQCFDVNWTFMPGMKYQ